MTTDQKAERHARRRELERMSKSELAQLHASNGALMGLKTYMKWHKEELIHEILLHELGN